MLRFFSCSSRIHSQELPYHQIPHMPTTSVKGHAGKMVLGDIDNKKIICLAGRVHGYEGTFLLHSILILIRLRNVPT